MAFKYNAIGQLVTENPKAAFKELQKLFKENEFNSRLVADQCGVGRVTLFRWVKKLEDAGVGDPRKGKSAKRGRPAKEVSA